MPVTWFDRPNTQLLSRLPDDRNFLELGIHHNFGFLVSCDGRVGHDLGKFSDRLLTIVPEAKWFRSHSTTGSSGVLNFFARRDLNDECYSVIQVKSGIEIEH